MDRVLLAVGVGLLVLAGAAYAVFNIVLAPATAPVALMSQESLAAVLGLILLGILVFGPDWAQGP